MAGNDNTSDAKGYPPPLNRKAEYISLHMPNPERWVNDNFEERIRNRVQSLQDKGLLKPWYRFW